MSAHAWQMIAWGDHKHMALFASPGESRDAAMRRATETMAGGLELGPESLVLDVGCGTGQAARHLVEAYGCRVHATNIDEGQLEEARRLTRSTAFADRIDYAHGDFHAVAEAHGAADLWWCQEALVHSSDKARVLAEASRVLRPGGCAVLSDLTLKAAVTDPVRTRIGSRIPTDLMWDAGQYVQCIADLGFETLRHDDWSEHVAHTYGRAREVLRERRDEILETVNAGEYHGVMSLYDLWVERAQAGDIGWHHWRLRRVADPH